ncbi:hypothetical protein E1I69_12815 [Bacillus timonensis]|uniref:DUF3794 domain-containing protein n=1 Tax=Bacillus timonensis TaxID=1033734 RepID=A0A4S3PQW4_9BACI|nr:hypothetical protein [Bacillus timonensis]THE12040.1 hypothetical protein E1I69_12815 [Bacillus timonensis]
MGSKHHNHNRDTERVCILTRKIYDWITRQIDVDLTFTNNSNLPVKFKCHGQTERTLEELCNFLDQFDDVSVNCFLSDKFGHPIETGFQENHQVSVTEIGQRQPVTVTLPNGDQVTLQRVKTLVRGFIGVEILDDMNRVVCETKHPIPFVTTQTFLLCAPEGTDLNVHVSLAECDATLICESDIHQLDISLTLCLEVQTEADVKLEIEARHCHPREEILEEIVLCPTEKFPPQCPEVFPAH